MSEPKDTKQLNQEIVRHVLRYGPCGFAELYDLFGRYQEPCGQRGGKRATERFRSRLNYLAHSKQLLATGGAATRRWRAPLQDAQPAMAPEPSTPAASPWVDALVPPARNDVMHCPVYVPAREPAMRPGSQDYKRCASRGLRC
ncbi:MAG: hypothetical protein ACT4NV_18035 [Rhodoferax sp.]